MIKFKLNSESISEITQKLFALKENIRKSWGVNAYNNPLPEGASAHTKLSYRYNTYSAVWLVPDSSFKIPVSKFNILGPSSDFVYQTRLLGSIEKKRLDVCIDDMSKGFVFDDDDSRSYKYRDSDDDILGGWDPCTHYLNKFQDRSEDYLYFSKDLNKNEDRLTYGVKRPHKEGNNWVCDIVLLSCSEHQIGGEHYTSRSSGSKLTDNESNLEALEKAKGNMENFRRELRRG